MTVRLALSQPSISMRPFVFLFALLVSAGAAAQEAAPPTPLTPTEAHERLAFFIGSWTVEESDPATAYRETCGWLPGGRRHVVCRSSWETASGPREGMSVFSYSAADSAYRYHGFRSGGRVETLSGTVTEDGRTWTFAGEEGTGDARRRARVSITGLDGGHFRFEGQSAEGDGPWSDPSVSHYRPLADAP